ncbi:MAG: recombinase family protein [Chitinophagaceae bacterium]|nr:recombinase family protein [Chitinophagaceae bacterium]
MKARYVRVSSLRQNEERQLVRQHPDEKLYVDKISGAIPFEDRPQARELLSAIQKREITYVSVSSIDRLGRSTLNVLQTIDAFTKLGVVLKVDNLGLESLVSGKENPTFKLIVSVLANISEMERSTLRERQLEGIQLAKLRGTYKGRVKGSTESREEILKKYNAVVYHIQRQNNSYKEIAKLCDCSKNTVIKVKKVMEATPL